MLKRTLAVFLAATLVALSPGLTGYEALAATIKTGVSEAGNVSGGQNGGASNGAGTSNVTPSLSLSVPSLSASMPLGSGAPQLSANAALVGNSFSAQPQVLPFAAAAALPALAQPGLAAPAAGIETLPSVPALSAAAPQFSKVGTPEGAVPGALGKSGAAIDAIKSHTSVQLSKPKADKGGVLSWIFDRSKKSEGSDAAVAGHESALKTTLAPSQQSTVAEPGQVPTPPSEKKKPGLLQRIRSNFDMSEFNKSEKSYILGQAVFLLAISVYMASLPLLVKALTGDAAMTGVARAVHYWVFGGASLFAGAIVDRTPMKRLLVGAAGTRALIFGSIGALTLMGFLPWAGFLALVGVNAIIVSMNHLVDIDTGGASKVFTTDKKIEKAGYVYDFIYYGMMLVIPGLIGLPMDWLDARFGPGIGAAAGFSLFAALMAVTAAIYAKRVQIHGETIVPAALKGVRDLLGRAWSMVKTGGRIVWEMPGRNWRTLKIILNNKAILARSSMATVENFVEDALFAVVLPTFALEVLKVGAFGNGLLLSAITAGGLMASTILMSRAQKIQKKIGTYRFLKYLTVGASLAFLPSIGLWAVPSLLMAIPAVMAMKFLYQPLRSRMRALLQTAIKNDPAAAKASADIYSLMTFFEVIAAGAGGLAFSWLFHNSGAGTAIGGALGDAAPMKIVTMSLMGISLVYLIGLRWVKHQIGTPGHKVFTSPEGAEAKAYEKLDLNLKKMGLAPAKTIRVEAAAKGEPTVAVLAPASIYKLAIAREGGRQAPGDVHLVLDPSWLIQETWQDGGNRLLMTKGLYFDADGQAVIAEYAVPRLVRYFANFYTMGANDRSDGEPLEANLDVPMSNSLQLEKVTNDKLLTRLLLAAKGVGVPATLAFLMAAHPLKDAGSAPLMRIESMPEARAEVKAAVEGFLEQYPGAEVVVKPSGPQFHSGRGVKFFARADVDAMVEHVLALKVDAQMTPDGAVLVDGRLTPPALYLRHGEGETKAYLTAMNPMHVLTAAELPGAKPKEKKDWNFRVLAARTPWNGAVTTGIFARAGAWGVPTTAEPANPDDAAAVVSFEDVIRALKQQHGLLQTKAEEVQFRADLDAMGANAVMALAANEAKRERKDGEPPQSQTDYIGLDVMVEYEGGKLVPKVIEVNDHDAGGQYQLDLFYPKQAGAHSREWVATMLQRARQDALKGKRIIMVGAGYEGKRFIFERAKELGVKIVLVDKGLTGWSKLKDTVKVFFGAKSQDHWAKDLVDEFIDSDNTKPLEAAGRLKEKLLRSARKRGELGGITTFWEDDVPLTADLARDLKLPYHTSVASRLVRSKGLTRRTMEDAGLPTPRFQTIKIAAHTKDIQSYREQLERATQHVGFPAVLKPAFGAAAQGVKRVNNKAEALAAFDEMIKIFSQDVIFEQGWDMVLEQYLDGPEYDVDVIMQGGKAKFVSTTDNWPTREPFFLATGSSLPSVLPKDKTLQIEELAVQTAKALGLTDGIIHIEGKYTKEGPRIIEANGRMGGVYVRDWVKAVWGVDLVEESFYTAAGIPVGAYKPAKPLTHLEGEFLIPEESGTLDKFQLADEARNSDAFHELRQMKKVGDRIAVPPNGYDRVGMLVSKGQSRAEAQKNLDALRAELILDIKK